MLYFWVTDLFKVRYIKGNWDERILNLVRSNKSLLFTRGLLGRIQWTIHFLLWSCH